MRCCGAGGVGEESVHAVCGVVVAGGVGVESVHAVCGVLGAGGVEGEGISTNRGVVLSCPRSWRGIERTIAHGSGIERGRCGRHPRCGARCSDCE